MMRLYITFFLFFCLLNIEGKEIWKKFLLNPDTLISKYDTSYVNPLPRTLAIRYYVNLKQNTLDFSSDVLQSKERFEAKDYVRYGIGFGYRWLIANGAYHFNPEAGIKKYDFQINVSGRRILYDLRTQWYKGYQVKDGSFRTDVSLVSLGGSLRYNFNHKKYSFKSSYDQTQWQLKSAGTPILGINYSYLQLSSDSLFQLGTLSLADGLDFKRLNIGVGGGYSQTFVRDKHWFWTFTLMVYLDNQFQVGNNFLSVGTIKINPEPRIAFGYNNAKYWLGVSGTFHQFPYQLSDELFLSYRYNSIKLLFVHRLNFNPLYRNENRK